MDEVKTYGDHIQRLTFGGKRRLLMWPPPKQLERAGLKHPDCAALSFIAMQMKTLRPNTVRILDVRNYNIEKETVLKRSHSDCGQHVILPGDRRKRTEDYLKEHSAYGEVWLQQEYVDPLKSVGEWRAFIVNGQLIHTVHTFRDDLTGRWQGTQAKTIWSLEEITYVDDQAGIP